MPVSNKISIYHTDGYDGKQFYSIMDLYNIKTNAGSKVISENSWGTTATYTDNIKLESMLDIHTSGAPTAANDFNKMLDIIKRNNNDVIGTLRRNEKLVGKWSSHLVPNDIWGSGWRSNSYTGNILWGSEPVFTTLSAYDGVMFGRHICTDQSTNSRIYTNANGGVMDGIKVRTYGGWSDLYTKDTENNGTLLHNRAVNLSTVLFGGGHFNDETQFFYLGGSIFNIHADDNNGRDSLALMNFTGDNNVIVINVKNDLIINHTEVGDDKCIAFITALSGRNNHFIINLSGKLKYNVSAGTGGSAFYFLATKPELNNSVTVINRVNLNTNIGYKYMIGNANKQVHIPAINNDYHDNAKIYEGIDRF